MLPRRQEAAHGSVAGRAGRKNTMRLIAAAFLLAVLPAPAFAACIEGLGTIGCTHLETFDRNELRGLSCPNLWYVRNSIYNDNGYCFKTKAAQAEFDNSDCFVQDTAKLRFNKHEQANINSIVRVEKEKGCRAP